MSRILNFNDGFETSTPSTVESIAATTVVVTPTGNISSTNVQSAFVELQGDINTANTNISLRETIVNVDDKINTNSLNDRAYADAGDDNHRNTVDGIHGINGSVVGTFDAQVITNKDIDGGTAANNSRITIPKNTKTILDGLTRKEGTIVFDTVGKSLYFDNGTVLQLVGSGSERIDASGSNTASTSIPTGTWTAVPTATLTINSHGALNTSGVFTVPQPDTYSVTANVCFTSNATGIRGVRIRKNGAATGFGSVIPTTTGGAIASVSISGLVSCLSSDTITIECFQNSGGALTLSNDPDTFTTFTITRK